MEPRRSLRWPILLGVVLIAALIALTVGWVLVSIAAALGSGNAAFYWATLGVGVALLVVVLAGVIVYLALTVKAIALSQRQSNFIDSVTHELKSPLASLKLSLQTLTRRTVPPEQQADFHRIMLQDVERLDTLIDHLLDAAKTLQRRPAAGADVADVAEILPGIAAAVLQRHGVASGAVTVNAAGTAPLLVAGRSADVEIVLRNLLDNAVKYSPEGASIEIDVDGGHLRVRDHGSGIAETDLPHVFERFYRAIGARSAPGSGLGLSIVAQTVEQHGGTVFAGNHPDGGAVVGFDLPE